MLRIGLTGGIASGKSAAAVRFAELGVPVIDADETAHAITRRGEPAFDEIVAAFGTETVGEDGELDRAALRRRVFAQPDERRRLEAILHPRSRREMQRRIDTLAAPYCVLVIPLLIEVGQQQLVDRILVIDAADSRRMEWLRRRSGLSRAEAIQIFAAQASRAERLNAADDVIRNDGSLEALHAEVDRLHEVYLRLARSSAETG